METPATMTAAPWTEPGEICVLATQRTFLTQEEMDLAKTGLYCLLLPKKVMLCMIHDKLQNSGSTVQIDLGYVRVISKDNVS